VVIGWSQYSNIWNLTQHQALIDLDGIKFLFKRMFKISSEIEVFVADKKTEYNLCFEDYG